MNLLRGRPTVAEINVGALRHNLREVRVLVGAGVSILAVVKANAYGHGAVVSARAFVAEGAERLGVATLEEGAELRAAGLQVPILLLGGVAPDQADDVLEHDLTPAVWDVDMGRVLATRAIARHRTIRAHLKIDTGMTRLGVPVQDAARVGAELASLPGLEIEGAFTHFACAEDVTGAPVAEQMQRFASALDALGRVGVRPVLRHLANSAAVMTLPAAHGVMVRPGIMLYGVPPDPELGERAKLEPAMRFRSAVLQCKRVPSGTSVSYGQTFRTARPSVLATVPVGYADGYPRCLSNRASVLVGGQRARVVGRVCMDLTVVDVTDIDGISPGDEVVLWGRQGTADVSCSEVAGWADTIPYELMTRVGTRVPRVFVGE